jgi:hypothetical protein
VPAQQFTTVQPPTEPTASQAGSAPTRAATPIAARTPECTARTLSLSFGAGDAGMSQQERVLRFTNKGATPCAIAGFPGVSYVTGDDGRQVGAPAVRTGKIGAQVNLAPGAVASTIVHSVDPGVFDPSACRPTPVRGLRIYAPDDTAALFIAYPSGAQGCAGTTPDPQLSVVTITAGPGKVG